MCGSSSIMCPQLHLYITFKDLSLAWSVAVVYIQPSGLLHIRMQLPCGEYPAFICVIKAYDQCNSARPGAEPMNCRKLTTLTTMEGLKDRLYPKWGYRYDVQRRSLALSLSLSATHSDS